MSTTTHPSSEAALWNRVIEPRRSLLSPAAARFLLALTFDEQDTERMNELAAKNQDGALSDSERKELESYVKVGDILSLLHLKARRSLSR
jgi:hypothetical protein